MSMRGYRSYGAIDPNAAQSLKNAKAAGLTPYVYHFPCTGQNALQQAQALVNALNGLYDMVWIDVETNSSPNCGWSASDFTNNCNFLSSLVKAFQQLNQKVGIYASQYMWTQIFGNKNNCANFATLPLWYPHYDNQPNFNDWNSLTFGGWKQPTMKQYEGTDSLCNASVDRDYEP